MKTAKVVILLERDFQDLEVMYPKYRFREAGLEVVCAGAGAEVYTGKYGYPVKADARIEDCRPADFAAVVVPGGWAPDFLRRHEAFVRFVREAVQQDKVVGAICHGGWLLSSAGVLNGRKVTSFFSIRDDLQNAGAEWSDREVVVDGRLVTSRQPDDLPAFCREILALLGRLPENP